MIKFNVLIMTLLGCNILQAQSACLNLPTPVQIVKLLSKRPVTDIELCQFKIGCNVTTAVKKRLLHLVSGTWTRTEINQYLDAAGEAVKHDSIARQLFITTLYRQPVDNSLIRLVALLNMKEALPVLQKALTDTMQRYNIETVELALARLGNQQMESKIVKDCQPNTAIDFDEWMQDFEIKFTKLFFINTQRSIYQVGAFLDTTKSYVYTDGRKNGKSAYKVIQLMNDFILNPEFHLLTKGMDISGLKRVDNTFVLRCKNWLTANKGRYRIKAYCP